MFHSITDNVSITPYVPLDCCACSCSNGDLKENHLEAMFICRGEKKNGGSNLKQRDRIQRNQASGWKVSEGQQKKGKSVNGWAGGVLSRSSVQTQSRRDQ